MAERPAAARGILHVVVIYAAFAALWILLSDKAVAWLAPDPAWITLASTLKGWLFVAITALLLYGLLRRQTRSASAAPAALPGRWPLLPLALVSLVILALTGAGIAHTVANQRETEVARLQTIADLKARQVSDWLRERWNDAEFARSSYFFAEQYRLWRSQGDPVAGVRLHTRLDQLLRNRGFSAVMLLDPDGNRLWATAAAPSVPAPGLRTAAMAAARDGKVHWFGPYRDLAGHVRLDFIAPLNVKHSPSPPRPQAGEGRGEGNGQGVNTFHDAGRLIAMSVSTATGPAPLIVLQVDPAAWLFPTLQAWPTPSRSGEALLFRRDGDQVRVLNELRHQRDTAARLHLPVATRELLAAQALRGETRQGEAVSGRDYRGEPVLGVVRAIAGTDWYLVAKLDRAELYEGAFQDGVWIGLIGLLTLIMAGTALVVLRQRQQLAFAAGIQHDQAEKLHALQLLDAVATASADAIFVLDRAGRFVLFNAACERITGKAAGEVIGRDERALFPLELAQRQIADNERIMASGKGETSDELVPTAMGGDRILQTYKAPLRGPDGQVTGLFGIARDITERKQAELALRESEGRFRALVEQSLAGIYIIQDGRFRYVNPGFAAIFGYDSPEELVDRVAVSDLVAPEERERVAENIRRRVDGDSEDIHYTFAGLRRDGSPIDVEVHGRAFDYQGRPAVIGLILDITARKAAEEALRESELRFHDIVRASADWVWEVDAEGRYTYASDSVHDLLGYTPAELIGKTPFDLMPAEEARRVAPIFADLAARRAPFRDLDNINLSKDGSLRHVQTNGMPILDQGGRLLGYRGLDRDVTERKQAELDLRESEARYRQLFEDSPDALMIAMPPTWRFSAANAAALAMFGVGSVAEFTRLGPWDVSPERQPDGGPSADLARAMLDTAMREGSHHFEWTHRRIDGRTFAADVLMARIEMDGVTSIRATVRDISERKAAEEQLHQRSEELERFNRATVGRELDMIELKQQINELARQLGREPPYPLAFLDGQAARAGDDPA